MNHRARLVTIDLDPTGDPAHGAQQLSFFNSHDDNACYLPMMGFFRVCEATRWGRMVCVPNCVPL
jgi:hypothetical protein